MTSPEATHHLHVDATKILGEWQHDDTSQVELRDAYLVHLRAFDNAMARSCRVGHLTASALVLNESRDRVLLTLHPKVGRWLQLGGHCEPEDLSLRGSAWREAVEEGGIAEVWVSEVPVRLDRHAVPCAGGMSEHLDVQFVAVVADDAREVMSDESDDLRWFSVDELPNDTDASVRALIRDALAAPIWA